MILMHLLLAQMGLPILCGIAWRIIRPQGLDADLTRRVLTTVVFNLLLPALVLSVLWRAKIGIESLKISFFGIVVIGSGAAFAWLLSKVWRIESRRLGAAMLAMAFPNVTYLGLPVLEQAFGPPIRSLVIQIDLFAATPMVLVLGAIIGRRYGQEPARKTDSLVRSLLLNPPLWTAFLAVLFNSIGTPMPGWLKPMLEKLSDAVIPLMLISLGLGLRWDSWRMASVPLSAVVMAIRLLVIPLFGVALGAALGFSGEKLTALVMEAGMPCMLMGVLYCDRYRLDTPFYAMNVALTTAASLISLPFWQFRVAGTP